MDISGAVKFIVSESPKTHKEIASGMGISQRSTGQIRAVINGSSSPTINWLERFCESTGVKFDDLIRIAKALES